MKRRLVVFLLCSSGLFPVSAASGKTKSKNPYDEKRLLEQNKRMLKENNAPEDFPNFIREGQWVIQFHKFQSLEKYVMA